MNDPTIDTTYYTFKPAVNSIETGPVYPQIQKMNPKYNYKANDSVYALSKAVDCFPDTINLDYFIANGRAKLTDVLSNSLAMINGFLISDRFKIVLEKFNLSPHKFFTSKFLNKNTFFNYHWLHIPCNLMDLIDYPNSSFFVSYNYSHNLGYIDISSKEDALKQVEKIKKDNPNKNVSI